MKRAKSRVEMRTPVPKPTRTAEKLLWAEKVKGEAEEGSTEGGQE